LPIKETVSDALWMGFFVGLGAIVIELILLGSFYLFDPAAKRIIEDHSTSLFVSFPVIFVTAFGFSLQFALEGQFWRGKWK
jgi:hypothetical protein